jgi:hypothetical protein
MDSTSGNYLSRLNRIPPSVRAFFLFLLTLLFRIPFRSHILFNWDSVNYAFGIQDFNVYQHRPHPPGYILYIGLGRLLTQLTKDPNASLVWISVISSAIAVAVTYLFARRIFKERDAIFSAALLMASPLLWLYDETALNYSIEMMVFVLAGYACYRMMEGESRWAYGAALILGIGGGIRQSTLIVLLPLFLFSLLALRRKVAVLSLLFLGFVCLAWGIPLFINTGGPISFIKDSSTLSSILEAPPFFDIIYSIFYGGGIGLILLFACWIGAIPSPRGKRPSWERKFLLFWLAPGFVVTSMFHMGQSGYVLFLLPPLFMYTPPLIREFINRYFPGKITNPKEKDFNIEVKLALTVFVFFLAGCFIFIKGAYWTIQFQDSCWREARSLIELHPPEQTIILSDVSRVHGFRHASYYLPEYHVYMVAMTDPVGPYVLSPRTIILGWSFESFQRVDNYQLDPGGNTMYYEIELGDEITGILMSNSLIADALQKGMEMEGQEVTIEKTAGFFLFTSVPKGMHTLVFRNGWIFFQA